MKTLTVTQAEKQHNVNHLHDAFIAAEVTPLLVTSIPTESYFTFDDAVPNASIQQVVTNYVFAPAVVLADIRVLANNFRSAVTDAATLPQMKAALTTELMLLMRELARDKVRDL